MTANTLEKSIFLKAEPEKVWAYLTDPDCLAEWFHRPDHALDNAGQHFKMCSDGGTAIIGEVLKAEAPTDLEYRFHVPPMGEQISTVKWRIDPVAGGCKLSLLHEGLPESATAFRLILALDKGWDAHFTAMRDAFHQNLAA